MLNVPKHIVTPPFRTNILKPELEDAIANPYHSGAGRGDDFAHLLPATFRSQQNNLHLPKQDVYGFLDSELCLPKLNDIQDWLIIVGRPTPPRPLHHQILIARNIVITERPDLHLVWTKHRIFIKPVPRFILDPGFWRKYLVCSHAQPQSHDASSLAWVPNCENQVECARRAKLASLAHGLLFSYAALVSRESDFKIALDHGLLPNSVTWDGWKKLMEQLLEKDAYSAINPRYWYGELRLSRLNKIYRFRYGRIFRAYSTVTFYTVAGDFFADNLGKLAAFLGYVVIVLTAMQVGLATDRLQPDTSFQRASYGFTVFSIIAPLLAVCIILVVFICLSISNWTATRHFQRERLREMGVLGIEEETEVNANGKLKNSIRVDQS